MTATRSYSQRLFALILPLGLLLAGCATRTGTVSGLLEDPAGGAPERSAVGSDPGPAPAAVAAGRTGAAEPPPTGTGAVESAPTAAAAEAGANPARLSRIHFDFNSYLLDPDARATLEKNARLLSSGTPTAVRIEGHCDERGTTEYNLALGERRARSAADYLRSLGISPDRMHVVSYGEERPLDRAQSEFAWASNRRAEFVSVTP